MVTIQDDGRGFPFGGRFTHDELEAKRLGPRTIGERARIIGARIVVDSRPGFGSRVELSVPRSLATPLAKDNDGQDPDRRRSPDFRDGLRRLLEAETDLSVVGQAVDAAEAIQLAGTLHPDILLLDVAMPKVSGLEALETLVDMPERACRDSADRGDRSGRHRQGAADRRARRRAQGIGDGDAPQSHSRRDRGRLLGRPRERVGSHARAAQPGPRARAARGRCRRSA
jgi:CheY-like chemotaxis protein